MITEINYQFTLRVMRLVLHCTLILAAMIMMLDPLWVHAVVTLSPTHDTLVDPNNPTTNYNADRLEVTYSNFPDFVPTRRSLLQFDLAASSTPLTSTVLALTVVETNLLDGGSVTLALYAAEDSWNETNVNWESRPNQGELLQTLPISAGFLGTIQFTAPAVSAYLEAQRTGDHLASFLLILDGGADPLGFGGNVMFENKEGAADGINGNEPVLIGLDGAVESQRLFLPVVQR